MSMDPEMDPAASQLARQALRNPGEPIPKLALPTIGVYLTALTVFVFSTTGAINGWVWIWVTIAVNAAVIFAMFSVTHEAVHYLISSKCWVNALVGRLAFVLVTPMFSFPAFRFVHIAHHKYVNDDENDPDAYASRAATWQLPFHLPLAELFYVTYYTRRLRSRPTVEYVETTVLFTVSITGLTIATVTGNLWMLAVVFLIPQRIAITLLGWWFDWLPHHGLEVMKRNNCYRAARIRVGMEWLFTPLMVGQNYHLVHHLHPSVPFYRYGRTWRRNEQAYLQRNVAIATVFGQQLNSDEYREWKHLNGKLWRLLPVAQSSQVHVAASSTAPNESKHRTEARRWNTQVVAGKPRVWPVRHGRGVLGTTRLVAQAAPQRIGDPLSDWSGVHDQGQPQEEGAAMLRPRRFEREVDPGPVQIQPRKVHFDFSDIPLHWIPGHPVASDMIGILNVVLPAAERWIVATYNEALPLVKDPKLADDMRGFIGQESIHADVHEQALHEFMEARGFDPKPVLDQIEYAFSKVLGPPTSDKPKRRRNQLCNRLWFIAAFEHYTAVLGDFALNSEWDEAGAHPTFVDLFRWHGAEEVEHRNVAHDVATYFSDSYLDRIGAMLIASTFMLVMFQRIGWYLVKTDPQVDFGWLRMQRLRYLDSKHGLLPRYRKLFGTNTLDYLRPGFTPEKMGSTAQAVAYLASSPAARAAHL